MIPISAQQAGRATVYTDAQGNRIKMEGNRPWRNNNPGNLRFTTDAAAREAGAIGRDKDGFAIFPDYETGRQALENWWQKRAEQGKTIKEALEKYAPKNENDLESYLTGVEKAIGKSRDTKISDLTPEEMKKLSDFIQKHEGYDSGAGSGKTTTLPPTGITPDTMR
ncbi:MAG: hypothetical protein AB1325_14530 [Nitrospirota bacterium]